MKILAFTDTHCDSASLEIVKKKSEQADLVICLGDISWFEEGMVEMLTLINSFPRPVIMLHGNHERYSALEEAAKPFENIRASHKQIIAIGEYDFITYGGDGFSRQDPEFESRAKSFKEKIRNPKKTILLLHGPPYDTNLDIPFEEYHSGNISFRAFIDDVQPALVLAGHIHESEGATDVLGETFCMNPGIYGEILDLENLPKKT